MAETHEKHEKLTEVKDNPHGSGIRRRMPGWRPDCIQEEDYATGSPTKDLEFVYPEEFIKITQDETGKIERTAFQPTFDNATDWILGGKLHDRVIKPPEDKTDREKFLDWLHDISNQARNYNASLYRLRYLRLKEEGTKMDRLPTDPATDLSRDDAEKDFKKNVKLLRGVLPPKRADRKNDIVDFTTVNGYIVSIRAVAHVLKDKELRLLQPGGSESSQWSLSSRFSSSMSKKSDPKEKKRAPKKAKKKK